MKHFLLKALLLFMAVIVLNTAAFSEGTREVMPTNINGTGLIVSTIGAFPLGSVGAYNGCPSQDRIYFKISDFTQENLYFGFRWIPLSTSGGAPILNNIYMKVFDPTGTLVGAPILMPTAGAGFINTYSEAIAGPNIGGATPSGYTPNVFTPAMNGDYWVEFYQSADGGLTSIGGGFSLMANYFDMTIAQANNTQYPGRVHCQKWAFSVYDPATNLQLASISSEANFYSYSADSVITKVDFQSGFKPLSFIIAVNNYGFQNTGNWLVDRMSVNSTTLPALANGYPVFLDVPDPVVYPPCPVPLVPSLVSPVIAGCPPGPYNIRFNAPQPGDYLILLDLNGTPGYQPASSDVIFELVGQPSGVLSLSWNGLDGLGVPVPANVTFPITFTFRKGRVNVPLYDCELNTTGFSITGVAPILSPAARIYWDDSQLSNIGSAPCTTGTNNFNLTGTGYNNSIIGQASPGHAWNGDGNPAFSIPAPSVGGNDVDNLQCNDFGNARLINTWAWGIELSVTLNLTLGCVSVSGIVWDDANNSAAGSFVNIQDGAETGTNAAGQLFASLIDPVTGNVLNSVSVNADGTYVLTGVPINATGMSVLISGVAGTPGSPPPAAAPPATWIATSPLTQTFNSLTTDIVGIEFGIEALPDSDPQNYTIITPNLNDVLVLNGPGTPSLPGPLSGSDFEDGTMGSGKTLFVKTVPTNVELWYNGSLLADNALITSYDPNLLEVHFTVANILSTSFTYAFLDAAGKEDISPALYVINWAYLLKQSITAFSATRTSDGIGLTWTALNETAGDKTEIQRSANGLKFITIGAEQIKAPSVRTTHYFTDGAPLDQPENYYRLKIFSGGVVSEYSKVISISANGLSGLQIYPNPFRDKITVSIWCAEPGKITLSILDSKGMNLRTQEFHVKHAQNILEITSLKTLPIGIYFLQVVNGNNKSTHKIFNR